MLQANKYERYIQVYLLKIHSVLQISANFSLVITKWELQS